MQNWEVQYSFIPGRGNTQIFDLQQVIQCEKKKSTFVCLEKVYDKVNKSELWNKHGIEDWLLNAVRML